MQNTTNHPHSESLASSLLLSSVSLLYVKEEHSAKLPAIQRSWPKHSNLSNSKWCLLTLVKSMRQLKIVKVAPINEFYMLTSAVSRKRFRRFERLLMDGIVASLKEIQALTKSMTCLRWDSFASFKVVAAK